MTDLIGVYGAGGFGREVLPIVEMTSAGSASVVFIDDAIPEGRTEVNGRPLVSWEGFLALPAARRFAVLAMANSRTREVLDAKCHNASISYFAVRAPNSMVLDNPEVGDGVILAPFSSVFPNTRIGRHFHANYYSYVAHDCIIGDYVTFAPGVHCNGNVVIGDHAYIGAGALLRQGRAGAPLRIGRGAVVGMGAVVTRDVAPGVTVAGNPARPLVKGA